jgi:hypothetical protein
MSTYRFKTRLLGKEHMLGEDHVEVTFVMPCPPDHEMLDLEGAEARKATARWLLASVGGIAKACGVDMMEMLFQLYGEAAFSIDHETLIKTIRETRCTPESLMANPPGGMDPEDVEEVLQHLMDSQAVRLDGYLKCSDDN